MTTERPVCTLLRMPAILLTNDDGIQAPGLAALEKDFKDLGDLWVVAPDGERSACSRAVTLNRPLRANQLGRRRFAVDGTPADCVLLAFRSLMPEPPAVVISGINNGFNVGEDLDYSGTVGGAAEAALQGARIALAVSVAAQGGSALLKDAAGFTRLLVEELKDSQIPADCYLNINFPATPTRRVRWTRQGNHLEKGAVVVADDPRGKRYYWIAERPDEIDPPEDTDRGALRRGCISLSLLTLDRNWHGNWDPPRLWDDGYTEEAS
ncbi:MAG TPA: 5'/3'-nucleotidase SurE [Myxococcota bacterium]|nr:5'/3'-nucleotidase SurE [Myxococcota bacterium]